MVSRMSGEAVMQSFGNTSGRVAPEVENLMDQVEVVTEREQQQQQQQPNADKPLPAEKAKQMTDSMNTFLESANTHLRFEFHDKLNEYYVTLVNSKTEEVVREIPSKKLMDIHAAMREFVGLLIDRKI